MSFTANVGGVDRALRFVFGLALVLLAAFGVIGVWGYVGAVPLLTAVVRFCPAYPLIGVSTCKAG